MTGQHWYSSHESLCELAEALVEEGELATPTAVVDFFQRPWKYQPEWEQYVAERAAESLRETRMGAAESALDIALEDLVMGWSCAAAAGDTLNILDAVCLKMTGTQNTYVGTDGNEYFYELSHREYKDGAITGSVWRLVGEPCHNTIPGDTLMLPAGREAMRAGNFRIAGDGKITRWPARFPREKFKLSLSSQAEAVAAWLTGKPVA